MFDANARGLPQGSSFFVYVHGLDKESCLKDVGIKKGDYLHCWKPTCMIEGHYQMFIRKGKLVSLIDEDWLEIGSLLSYEGNWDGTGFICEEAKRQCMKIKEEIENND